VTYARTAALLLAWLLLARTLAVSAVDTWLGMSLHRGWSPVVTLLLSVLGTSVVAPRARGAWATLPRSNRAPVGVVVGVATAALMALHDASYQATYYAYGYVPDRILGEWPFRGGETREEDRVGYHMTAHTLADGTRACGLGDVPPDAPTIVLIGDSWTYGVGLPDEETLCWHLRARAEAAGHVARWINLGQPGANLRSHAATLRYAVDTFRPDLVLMGNLPVDDSRGVDLNDQRRFAHSLLFRAVAAVVGPQTLWDTLTLLPELMPADGWGLAYTRAAATTIAETATVTGTPVWIEWIPGHFTDDPWPLSGYRAVWEDLVATHPAVHLALTEPLRTGPDEAPWIMAGDGHPTGEGNAERARRWDDALRPWWGAR
jgi:hypothetical protein